jgi:predicted nuclease with TOPRIM domain
MLIKVSLIVAILAGLGALVVSHVQVAEKINSLKTTLDSTTSERDAAKEAESKATKEARDAKADSDQKRRELADTQTKLETATSHGNTQQKRADDAEKQLNDTRGALTEAQRDLGAWKALGRPVDQIEKALVELQRRSAENVSLNNTNKDLQIKLNYAQTRLREYEGERQRPPELPESLRGRVVAVDPKWDFVVLNVGSDQKLVERGELLVSRDGRLVAKLRVTSVQPNSAIANVLQEWKQADVMDNDEVLPAPPPVR